VKVSASSAELAVDQVPESPANRPVEGPEPSAPPIEDPEYPEDPGPVEDPGKRTVRGIADLPAAGTAKNVLDCTTSSTPEGVTKRMYPI